ncbi:unnamed protein product [Calicophoron daubneyi]|uniref:Uncharacterized protein n=1 Tax=Calicophoron daubneyi TaxID=300641 RepID=A0AAV2TSL2_CALDB
MASNRARNMSHLMNHALDNYVMNYDTNQSYRTKVDAMQTELRCCGSNSSADYKGFIPKSCRMEETKDDRLLGCTFAMRDYVSSQFRKMYIWSMVVIFVNILAFISGSVIRRIFGKNEGEHT